MIPNLFPKFMLAELPEVFLTLGEKQ